MRLGKSYQGKTSFSPAALHSAFSIFVLPAMTEEQLNILRKYFPAPALPSVAQWIPRYGVYLCITRARRSKHGDFTLAPVRGMHRITVNGSLHPYAFLLTFVHELAHLRVLKRYGSRVMPHGAEWKAEFRALMLTLDLRAIYPSDVLVPLADYLKTRRLLPTAIRPSQWLWNAIRSPKPGKRK